MKWDCWFEFKFYIPTPEQHHQYVFVTIQSVLSMFYMLRLLFWFYEFHVPCRGKSPDNYDDLSEAQEVLWIQASVKANFPNDSAEFI